MYKNLGYIVYRTVIDYYAGPGDIDEDAFGKCQKTRLYYHICRIYRMYSIYSSIEISYDVCRAAFML